MELGYLLVAFWVTLTEGSFIFFNNVTRQLFFRCPEENSVDGDLLGIILIQIPNHGENRTLASWVYGEEVKRRDDRVEVLQAQPPYQLEAVLNQVSCYDAVTYECLIKAENNRGRGGFLTRNAERFHYAEISGPYIDREPLKDCYQPGDKIRLNCSANIGSTDNSIIWESGFQGGRFSPITPNTERALTRGQEMDNSTCNLQSRFSLDYMLTASDNGKIFQCRLSRSNHVTSFNVSVWCENKECSQETKVTPYIRSISTIDVLEDLNEDSPKQGFHKDNNNEADIKADAKPNSEPTWPMYVAVIIFAIAAVLVAMAILLRQWRKKEKPQPLIVVDSPSSSEYGYSQRRLPAVPYLQRQQESNTTPKWVSTHHLDFPFNANTSIYVSMTGIDSLHKQGMDESKGQTPGSQFQSEQFSGDNGELGDEPLKPDMRTDRSESLYSNKEAIDREVVRARAVGPVSSSPGSESVADTNTTGGQLNGSAAKGEA